ncbi:hypothetical protein CRI77_08610 [Mycolicibacterium duvalii]|uniref:Putative lipoprotein LppK n=1 Tax=Mycolicibacterium duvalii TaxID=39688 RepID=A0A7I7JY04_9MYCO|nr:hypothetical protein [Mycolicibacterium duvalii]MCV7369464.1 hypothetical protein [Mycolicibacterium duvalii]PEG42233.1 hypothetical protein CRI77_08610 [Mycolicibacterium duvalii]BBX16184.1 putative lipoprotein LppK [Mycolicibacterium duvalii]
MRRTASLLSAATLVAALGVSACTSRDDSANPVASPSVETSPAPSVGLPVPSPPAPGGPPLPPADVLTDVMYRLTDPAVPGAEKLPLIETAAAAEAEALDRFTAALRDNRALPLIFEARDMAWSPAEPGHVVATVIVTTANPGNGTFTYPMEFLRTGDSWQLTQRSADQLLQLQSAPEPTPAPPPR